jgi:Mn-dependent DtxR family transcriptional regulator
MHDEDMPNQASKYDEKERDIVYLLTEPGDRESIWSVEDIAREIETDDPMALIHRLLRAGLVNRTSDGFVFATRAGVRMAQLVDRAVWG